MRLTCRKYKGKKREWKI